MSTVLTPPETEAPPDTNGGNHIFDPGPPGGGGGDPWDGRTFPLRSDPYRTAVWVFLIPVLTFFAALTRAMLAARGASANWASVQLPPMLYVNTAVLLASSLALEIGRRAMRASRGLTPWLWTATLLGFGFLYGQLQVWRELAGDPFPLAPNAARAFFYLMTVGHGVHLVVALSALAYLSVRQARRELTLRRRSALTATAIFWHFMAALWIYILALLAWCG